MSDIVDRVFETVLHEALLQGGRIGWRHDTVFIGIACGLDDLAEVIRSIFYQYCGIHAEIRITIFTGITGSIRRAIHSYRLLVSLSNFS